MALTAGTRLRCEDCGAEAIIIKAADAELVCCGKEMTATFAPASPSQQTQ